MIRKRFADETSSFCIICAAEATFRDLAIPSSLFSLALPDLLGKRLENREATGDGTGGRGLRRRLLAVKCLPSVLLSSRAWTWREMSTQENSLSP